MVDGIVGLPCMPIALPAGREELLAELFTVFCETGTPAANWALGGDNVNDTFCAFIPCAIAWASLLIMTFALFMLLLLLILLKLLPVVTFIGCAARLDPAEVLM